MADTLDLRDMQGIIARGYGDLKGACYILLQIDRSDAARRWLGAIASIITPGDLRPQELALNVAFTHSGLQKLGLSHEILAMFSYEFRRSMTRRTGAGFSATSMRTLPRSGSGAGRARRPST